MPGMAQKPAQQQRPNIIFFLVDDMGWMDTSLPFGDSVMALNRQFHTPNMERLAKAGMVFTNAYVNPVCTPTRTSILSGMSAARTHITNWTNITRDQPTDHPDSLLQPPVWNINGISPTPLTGAYTTKPFPQYLREAGYQTLHVGKAHWGSQGTPGSDPLNLGFITNVAGGSLGHPQSYYGERNYGNEPGKISFNAVPGLQEFYGQDVFLSDALTRKAKAVMEVPISRKQPFFLYLGHYAVHTPIQPDKRYVDRYLAAGLSPVEAAYASLVEGMDKSLGDIMDFLREKGIDKNTILIFMSDNGGLSNAGRGGIRNTHNLPLRAGKGSVYEGGIRVPLIVHWPGITKPGSRTRQYVMAEDLFPTLLAMAGINRVDKQPIDGRSYVPVLKNASYTDTSRALVFHYPNRWTTREDEAIAWASAIRKGPWKLVYLMKLQKLELYNLQDDIGEQHDLATQYPQQVSRLARLLGNELRARNAQMPTWKANGKQVAWPDEL
jgi:arylsulfatase A-like enzyme